MLSLRAHLPKDKRTRVNVLFEISDGNLNFVSLILHLI